METNHIKSEGNVNPDVDVEYPTELATHTAEIVPNHYLMVLNVRCKCPRA